jgi:tetratricopeptide (TPR) repeat protein
VINLLLVLQVITIGLTILSERYTYIPYIGLAFMTGMILSRIKYLTSKILWPLAAVFVIVLGIITYKRVDVWKNSDALWTDVIKTYPGTPYPRVNRANYLSKLASAEKDKRVKDSLFSIALEDCNIALSIKPNLATGFEKRGLIFVELGNMDKALADADSLVKYDPDNKIGYDIRGTVYFNRNEPEKAMENYNRCIEINPEDHRSYNNRGTIYLNFYKQYQQALAELNKAININPLANYILNRSVCYYKMGDMIKAKEDALLASQKGAVIPDNYKAILQLK